jgi:hypothetical protein
VDRPERTCRRKVRYTSPVFALRRFIDHAIGGRWHWGLSVYRCEMCGGLHLGHRISRRGMRMGEKKCKTMIFRMLEKLRHRLHHNPKD